jgi:hypothetical protein
MAHQLGAYRETLAPHKRVRVIVAAGVLALIFTFIGALMIATAGKGGGGGAVVFGIAMIVIFVGLFGWALLTSPVVSAKARQRQIYVFEHGYVRVTRQGPLAFRWDAVRTAYQEIVTTYYNGISTGTQYRYRITFADGRIEKLTTYVTDMAKFGPLVQSEIARVQVPQARQMLRAGHSLAFGDIVLSGAGLTAGSKGLVAWPELRGVQIFRGQVRVLRHGKRMPVFSTAAKKVPNLYTLLTVANESIGVR